MNKNELINEKTNFEENLNMITQSNSVNSQKINSTRGFHKKSKSITYEYSEFDSHDSSMINNNILSNRNLKKKNAANIKNEEKYNPYQKLANSIIQNQKTIFDKIGITLTVAIDNLENLNNNYQAFYKNLFFEKFKLYYLWLMENNIQPSKIGSIKEIDFSNRLEEILKQDTFKLVLNITLNLFESQKLKYFLDFMQRLSTFSTINTILKRKKFLIFEKLLILRNVFSIRDTNLKLCLKIYFYNWKRILRINSKNSFEKKLMLRKIVNEKIKNLDYFQRLIKLSFFNFLKFYRSYSINDEKTFIEYNEDSHESTNKLQKYNSKSKNDIIDIKTINSNNRCDIGIIHLINAFQNKLKYEIKDAFDKIKTYSISIKNISLQNDLSQLSNSIEEAFKEIFFQQKVYNKNSSIDMLDEVKNHMLIKYESVHKHKFANLFGAYLFKNRISKIDFISKTLLKYFKRWKNHTDNSQLERFQIILEEKEILFHDMKFLKFLLIFRNNLKKKFLFFMCKFKLYLQKKKELDFLARSYLFFENNYNLRLKNFAKASYIIEKFTNRIKPFSVDLSEKKYFIFKESDSYSKNLDKQEINNSAVDLFLNISSKNNKLNLYNPGDKNIKEKSYSCNLSINSRTFTIENCFYLWRSKIIKTYGLVSLLDVAFINKFFYLQGIINKNHLKYYYEFISKLKKFYYYDLKLNEYIFDNSEFYFQKIFYNQNIISKKKFMENLKRLYFFKSIKDDEENKSKLTFLMKIFKKTKKNYQNYLKKSFLEKLALHIKGTLLYNWSISTVDFIEKLNKIFYCRYSHEFFYKMRIFSFKEPKFQCPKIDYLITKNTSEVIKTLHSSVQIKTKQQKLFKLIKIYCMSLEKRNILNNANCLILTKFFYIWIDTIKEEKMTIMKETKMFEDSNDEMKKKIMDYSETNQMLEKKLTEISQRAENCNNCYNMVDDDLSQTYTSVRDETNKVNNIPSMHVHRFIKKFSLDDTSDKYNSNNANVYFNNNQPIGNEINKLRYGTNVNFELQINDFSYNEKKNHEHEAFKFNNNLNTFNNLNNNSINLYTGTDERNLIMNSVQNKQNSSNKIPIEEENILDENTGGLEFYKYLERTHEEIQMNIQKLDEEYEFKSKFLIEEVENLYKEINELID